MFAAIAFMPSVTGPNRPYSFFFAWPPQQQYAGTFAYVQKFYPDVKTVASMTPDMADVPLFMGAAQAMAPKYGLEWLGVEKFPLDTKDFMPVISRVLAKNPDAIDTGSTGGSMVGLCGLLIKQLREAGFAGPILMPTSTQIQAFEEVVPSKYLNRVVINGMDPGSAVASEAYRAFWDRYHKKFNLAPGAIAALLYNPLKGFFEFLNGTDTLDSTAWMNGYAGYHWQGLFGFENYWVGKPLLGIDRCTFGPSWWANGQTASWISNGWPLFHTTFLWGNSIITCHCVLDGLPC